MSGEQLPRLRVVKAVAGGNGGANHARRIAALERDMATVKANVETAANNSAEILAIISYAKSGAGLVKKWGPRAVVFGAGLFTSAGIGNPNVWKFVSHFFG